MGLWGCVGISEALGGGAHGEQVACWGCCVFTQCSSWEITCSCSQRETRIHPMAWCEPTDLPCFSKPCGYCMPPAGYRHRYELAFQLWSLVLKGSGQYSGCLLSQASPLIQNKNLLTWHLLLVHVEACYHPSLVSLSEEYCEVNIPKLMQKLAEMEW